MSSFFSLLKIVIEPFLIVLRSESNNFFKKLINHTFVNTYKQYIKNQRRVLSVPNDVYLCYSINEYYNHYCLFS